MKEVLQLMSVLTHDNRFEEVANAAVKGDKPKNMRDVLDKVEEIGEMKKAKETAARMKARGFSNEDISDMVGVGLKIVEKWFPEGLARA